MLGLTTSPHLHIRRPSPTTAEFTVTTLPTPTPLPLRALQLLVLLLRILLSIATLLLLLQAEWTSRITSPLLDHHVYETRHPPQQPTHQDPSPPPSWSVFFFSLPQHGLAWLFTTFSHSSLGHTFSAVADSCPPPILVLATAATLYLLSLRAYKTESLLVLRGLGVQTSSTSRSYFGGTATRFIPTEKIQDVLVNEAFRGFEVRYYLVVVVEGEEDVVVVFPGLLPRRRIVEEVWRGARHCLYEGKGGVGDDQ